MAETSRFWDGTVLGDATVAPYDAANEFAEVMAALATTFNLANRGGVFRTTGTPLAVSSPGANLWSIAAGAAIVDGTYYETDGGTYAIATPVTSTRIDTVILRKTWASQVVRVGLLAGVEGSGVPPTLVQILGNTWDIPIADISITTGGVIAITSRREFLPFIGIDAINTAAIQALAVTEAKIAASAVTTTKIASDAVTHVKLGTDVKYPYRYFDTIDISGGIDFDVTLPANLRLLELDIIGRLNGTAAFNQINISVNDDTGFSYRYEIISGSGGSTTGVGGSPEASGSDDAAIVMVGSMPSDIVGGPTDLFGHIRVRIARPSSGVWKLIDFEYDHVTDNGSGGIQREKGVGYVLWRDTAAITKLTFTSEGGSFKSGSICDVYGVYDDAVP